jgi:G3E family GTPase
MTDSNARQKTPVSMITGFLGSGKTTLINALLKHPDMAETAVLVNEFGQIGLDHLLVEALDDDVVLMDSGCLCCTIRDDLSSTLRSLFARRAAGEVPDFRRVLIETTGLADPAPILHTLLTDPGVLEHGVVDGVVTTVDAVNGARQFATHPESVKQAAVADRLLITKTDIAPAGEVDDLRERLARINAGASIEQAIQGDIGPQALFGVGPFDSAARHPDVGRWLGEQREASAHRAHHHDVNRHDDSIRAYCLRYDEPLPWEPFVGWIRTLIATHGEKLLRIKGIVNVAGQDKPIAIHGVQHLFHDPAQLPDWPDGDTRSRIVFITRDLPRETVERMLEDMKAGMAKES